jgi:glutamate synthase domain-containing protein 2
MNNHISLVHEVLNHHARYAGFSVPKLLRKLSFTSKKPAVNTAETNGNTTTLKVLLVDNFGNPIVYNLKDKKFEVIQPHTVNRYESSSQNMKNLRVIVTAKDGDTDQDYTIMLDNIKKTVYLVEPHASGELSFDSIAKENPDAIKFSEATLQIYKNTYTNIEKDLTSNAPAYTLTFQKK